MITGIRLVIFLVTALTAGFFLWLGLYIITRDLPGRSEEGESGFHWRRPTLAAGAALVFYAIYLSGTAMEVASPTQGDYLHWQRLTWWSVVPAGLLFFLAVLWLVNEERAPPLPARVALYVLTIVGAVLAFGLMSGYALEIAAIRVQASPFQPYFTPIKPGWNVAFYLFLGVCCLGAALLLIARYWTAQRRRIRGRFGLLALGSLFFVIGVALTLSLVPLFGDGAPKQLGDWFVVIGAAVISYGIARYNALRHEQILIQDFVHSLSSAALTVLLFLTTYGGVTWLMGYAVQPLALLLLTLLAVLTQTPFNWEEAVTDRLLLPRWAVGYRRRLVLMRRELLTSPDPLSALEEAEATIVEAIQVARLDEIETLIQSEIDHLFQYSRFDNPDELAASRLHSLAFVQARESEIAAGLGVSAHALTDQQQATALRELLVELVEQEFLRSTNGSEELRIEQAILRCKYVEGLARPAVECRLHDDFKVAVTGGAYSRHLAHARSHLANILFEHELDQIRITQAGS